MRASVVIVGALALTACGEPAGPAGYEPGEELSGGDTTVFDTTRDAYARAARNLVQARRDPFFGGNAFFNRSWVTAPASTIGVDGLGPTFNARSCSTCHFKDGRGAPPEGPSETPVGLLVRISVPGASEHGGPKGEPRYGDQLQIESVLGVETEATVRVSWIEVPGTYADGTPYSLRRPEVVVEDLAFGPLASDVMMSPRVAPAVFGLGLLEAVDEAAIVARADADDADGDGISGRPNRVWDVARGAMSLGRFGWKANQPSVAQQNAGAFLGDMGISSPLFTEQNCPEAQASCRAAEAGGAPEIDQAHLDDIAFYVRLLAVPGRRDVEDERVLRGKGLFHELGCASCHVPSMATGAGAAEPELAGQTIYPYSDLLLHDLGDGLADGRPDYGADGREWRTTPLWGVGLVPTVNRHSYYLHDGRARGLAEAVLWHGGEAEQAKEAFRNLTAVERADLIVFLESL
jgi:CxxC motif-containing protein (DUF1111 family)